MPRQASPSGGYFSSRDFRRNYYWLAGGSLFLSSVRYISTGSPKSNLWIRNNNVPSYVIYIARVVRTHILAKFNKSFNLRSLNLAWRMRDDVRTRPISSIHNSDILLG